MNETTTVSVFQLRWFIYISCSSCDSNWIFKKGSEARMAETWSQDNEEEKSSIMTHIVCRSLLQAPEHVTLQMLRMTNVNLYPI